MKNTSSSKAVWPESKWGWDPILCFQTLKSSVNEMFSELFKTKEVLKKDLPWHPVLDVYQTEDKLIIEIEIPGFNKNEIHIHATSDFLIVEGKKSSKEDNKKEIFHHKERPKGEFIRNLPLPCLVKAKKMKAKLKDGLLTITLPIRKRAPKKITMKQKI